MKFIGYGSTIQIQYGERNRLLGIDKPHVIPPEPKHKYCKWCEEMINASGPDYCCELCEKLYHQQDNTNTTNTWEN